MSGNFDLRGKVTKGVRRIIQARYSGTCARCLQDIEQGDNIEMDPLDGAIHFGCREDDG